MSTEGVGRSRGHTVFLWLSWIPLATFVAMRTYVGQFEGLGQWAAAPLLLIPVVLSAVFLLTGASLALQDVRRRGVQPTTWIALTVSSVPCLWLVWRLIVTR